MTARILALSLLLAAPAVARERDSRDLGEALRRFAAESGWQILLDPLLVGGKKAPSGGAFRSVDQVQDVLEKEGLRARFLRARVIIVERAETRRTTTGAPAPVLPIAQTPPDPDIVVTALKRPSIMARTPGIISVIKGDDIVGRNFTGLSDVATLLPELSAASARTGDHRLSLRGMYGTGEATVGLYYGETPITAPSGTSFDPGGAAQDSDLLDVDRIELLHGPQGTLYGASSMGGTMRVLFNQPDMSAWQGRVGAGFEVAQGGQPGWRSSAVVNIPIMADRLAIRTLAYRRASTAFIDNPGLGRRDIGAQQQAGGRAILAWALSPRFTLTATAMVDDTSADDNPAWQADAGPYRNVDRVRAPNYNRLWLGSITGELSFDGATLLATTSRYRRRYGRGADFSRNLGAQRQSPAGCARVFDLPAPAQCSADQLAAFGDYVDARLPALLLQPLSLDSFNGEVRASSNPSGWLRWTVGAFFESREDHTSSFTYRGDRSTGELVQPLDLIALRTIDIILDQRAIFAEISLSPTPRLTATIGWRGFDYRRTASGEIVVPNLITGTNTLDNRPHSYRENGSSAKMELSYRPTENLLTYVQIAQGFRPGGVNITPTLSDAERTYRSDGIWSYELGLKASLAKRVQLEIAAYHISWHDLIYFAISDNGAFFYNRNVGSARIDGAELRASGKVTGQIEAYGRFSFVDARLGKDILPISGGRPGDRLPDISPFTYSAGLIWSSRLGHDANLGATLNVYGNVGADSQFNTGQPYAEHLWAQTVTDISVNVERGRWRLGASVQNLFDIVTGNRIQSSSFADREIYGSRPRTAMITVAVKL